MAANDQYTLRIREIADNFEHTLYDSGIFSTVFLSEIGKKLQEKVYELLQSPKPKILVYGIYNSGKSTLVNALCEKEVAATADRPMTDCIREYDAGKYILIDSPGVDAPMEHEKIADSQIGKCHIILFVISSKGGFESITNYEKMLPLIQMDVPFYIVLNERAVPLPKAVSPEQREQILKKHQIEIDGVKRKIIRNLITVSKNQQIADQYEVIVVNALRAWKGVELEKPALVEKSNISTLRMRMEQILDGKGALQWLQSPLSMLDSCISDAEAQILSCQGDSDYTLARQALEAKLDGVYSALAEKLRDSVYSRREEVYRMFSNNEHTNSSAEGNSISETIIREVEYACDQEYGKLSRYIREKFPEISVSFERSGPFKFTSSWNGAYAGRSSGSAPSGFYPSGEMSYPTEPVPSEGPLFPLAAGAAVGAMAKLPKPSPGLIISAAKYLIDKIGGRERGERERYERLVMEAAENNRAIADRVAEEARRRQDIRAQAYAFLDQVYRDLQEVLLNDMREGFDLIRQKLNAHIQEKQRIDDMAKELLEQLRVFHSEVATLRIETI